METKLFKVVLKALWSASGDAILVVDDYGAIVGANEHVTRLLGWDPDALIGNPVETLIPPEKRGVHRFHRRYFATNPTPRRMGNDSVLRALRSDGCVVPVDISLSAVTMEEEGFTVVVIRDASLRVAHENHLKEKALRDPLTHVYNRYYFDEEIERVHRAGTWPVGVIIANINGLPKINETYGHVEGDKILRLGAEVLSDSTRPSDMVSRLSGDKFVVLLEDTTLEETIGLVQQIHDACPKIDSRIPLKMSLGYAVAPSAQDLRVIIRAADARMEQMRERELA